MGIYKTSASFHIRESRGSQTAKPYFASFHQGERRGSQTAKPYTSRAWKALPYLRTRLWNVSPPTPSGGVFIWTFPPQPPRGESLQV